MANLKLIGKKGSQACKEIRASTNILRYTGKTKYAVDALINYGLARDPLDNFFRRFPSAKRLPMVNRHVGYSKLGVCQRAANNGVKVPVSKVKLTKSDAKSLWIEKRVNSIGGKGICKARGKGPISGKYYQQFIEDRKYELRVHAFLWIPQEDWRVQKRFGKPDEIAWNYKNGGHFASVYNPRSYKIFKEAEEVSEKILKMLGMSFGAVDFLVDRSSNLYFLEINSAPGFTELSKPIYVDAFSRLKAFTKKEVLRYCN